MRPLLAVGLVLAAAAPAQASAIPLIDLPPNVRVVSLGVDPNVAQASADYSMGGWIFGATGSFQIKDPNDPLIPGSPTSATRIRESNHMVALRAGRRWAGTYPFSVGYVFSLGMNLVDDELPAPANTLSTGPYLLWFQPALALSTPVFSDQVWLRGTFGPVLNRWSEGTFFLPFFSPNVELSFRVSPAHELVLGGGLVPWGIGWRGAF